MTNSRIVDVLLALTDMDMTYPTAYDIVIKDIQNLVDSDTRNKWTCVTVNTDDSSGPGYHYNHVVYGISPSGIPSATFLEPLSSTNISKHMAQILKEKIPNAKIKHFAVGAQHD